MCQAAASHHHHHRAGPGQAPEEEAAAAAPPIPIGPELRALAPDVVELRWSPATLRLDATRLPLAERYGALERFRVLRQGDASLSFYARAEPATE